MGRLFPHMRGWDQLQKSGLQQPETNLRRPGGVRVRPSSFSSGVSRQERGVQAVQHQPVHQRYQQHLYQSICSLLRWRCSCGAVPERVLYGLHQVRQGNKTKRKSMMSKDISTMYCYFRGDQSEGGRTEAAEWLPYEAVYDSNKNDQLKWMTFKKRPS